MEEYILHFGVKGMHWGVRRNIQNAGRALNRSLNKRQDAQNAKLESYHQKRYGKSKSYTREYDKRLKKNHLGSTQKNHRVAIAETRKHRASVLATKISIASHVSMGAAMIAGEKIAKRNREKRIMGQETDGQKIINLGKNILQAVKGSKLRYTHRSRMTNVVG